MYTKSFLNYPGGKYKIIRQLLHYFPKHVTRFVDLFAGSLVVTENYNGAKNYLANDINKPLISLQKYLLSIPLSKFINQVNEIIKHYNLSDTYNYGYSHYHANSQKGLSTINRHGYLKLRSDFNNKEYNYPKCTLLYVLIVYGFNNQIRFNKHDLFNNPVGKRDWNKAMRTKLRDFYIIGRTKDIDFHCKDFTKIIIKPNDFIYADPPYRITDAVYNDTSGWSIHDDKRLFKYLDYANKIGAKFALSNVLIHKGRKNNILMQWSKKYHTYHINKSYNNSSYHSKHGKSYECLITNYKALNKSHYYLPSKYNIFQK